MIAGLPWWRRISLYHQSDHPLNLRCRKPRAIGRAVLEVFHSQRKHMRAMTGSRCLQRLFITEELPTGQLHTVKAIKPHRGIALFLFISYSSILTASYINQIYPGSQIRFLPVFTAECISCPGLMADSPYVHQVTMLFPLVQYAT